MKSIHPSATPRVIIRDTRDDQWLSFTGLKKIYSINSVSDIVGTLVEIEQQVYEHGFWAAGWLSYEAAPAFDTAHVTHKASEFPLLWIALFEACEVIDAELLTNQMANLHFEELQWLPGISENDYAEKIAQIKHELSQGNSYQVNFTIRRDATFAIPVEQEFLSFAAEARYGAFVDTDRYCICSASPELFFEKYENEIRCRPMKGTAARGRFHEEDQQLRDDLAGSEKDRAENLMIVDMIRNDLGKIAKPGSVNVSRLFEIEQYPTVWQMTSTVGAKSDASLVDLFSALFPCASITGAPKANTMKIIHALEPRPRNIYTGTIGFIRPDMSMQFNVAIRSLLIDKTSRRAEYGVGGGIVWDSDAESEFRECQIKTRVLTGVRNNRHDLLETLLWEPEKGYFLLDYHFDRLQRSAQYFDYRFDLTPIKHVLENAVSKATRAQRVRLLVNKFGEARTESTELPNPDSALPYRIVLAEDSVDDSSVFLFHKTTERACYERFLQHYSEFDDVLLHNNRGEITESLIANLIVEIDGKKFTPPVESGLLAGTYRQYLLDLNQLEEKIIRQQDLVKADHIYLANSVRRIWPVQLEKFNIS